MTRRWRITICGNVQGVFYRKSTVEQAQELQLTGWVKNLSNGCVFCEAEGEETLLHSLVQWMKQGPPMAEVTSVDYEEIELEEGTGFTVHY